MNFDRTIQSVFLNASDIILCQLRIFFAGHLHIIIADVNGKKAWQQLVVIDVRTVSRVVVAARAGMNTDPLSLIIGKMA